MQSTGHRAWPRARKASRSIVLGVFAVLLLASDAAAGNGHLQLGYRVYAVGVHAANLGLGVSFDAAAYDADAAAFDLHGTAYAVSARFKTTGLVKGLTRWKTTAYSQGTLVLGDVVPVRAGYRDRQWWRRRRVELGFDRGTPKVVRMKPRKKSRVSASRLKGSLDPAGAFLAVLARFDARQGCGLRIPIFDGRRLRELVGETDGDGTGRLQANRYSPFAGPTVDCRVRLERKAGFKPRPDGQERKDIKVQLRMARVFDEMPPVPVRLASDTRYGAIVAHLVRAKLDAAGLKRELRPHPGRKRRR